MSEDYWDGALFVYHADITNGAGGSGTNSYTIVPGAGNELEILYGHIFNGDTVARGTSLLISSGANLITTLLDDAPGLAINPGAVQSYPHNDEVNVDGGSTVGGVRLFLAGTMDFEGKLLAVGSSDDTRFAMAARLRGGMPIITEAGISTPTININVEQVF